MNSQFYRIVIFSGSLLMTANLSQAAKSDSSEGSGSIKLEVGNSKQNNDVVELFGKMKI